MAGMWYIAECQECTPVLPQPFTDEAERDRWADEHSGANGHTVAKRTESTSRRAREDARQMWNAAFESDPF